MANRWNVQEQGSKRRRSNQNTANLNRKSTDTSANSGKTINRPAQKAKPVQQKKPVYFRSKDDARPVYRNPAKQKTAARPKFTGRGRTTPKLDGWYGQPKQAAQPKQKLTKKWGVNFGNDFDRVKRGERLENNTPQSRLIDDSPKEQMKRDLAPGSDYRMRNWINSRVQDTQEDRGTTIAQANRLAALYRAVDPTTKGYTREQAGDLHRQIQNAPVNLQELWIKYGDRLEPMIDAWPEDEGDTAHYSPRTGRVYGIPEEIAADTSTRLPFLTHWHEYGHNLDHLAGENEYDYHPLYTKKQDIFGGQNLGDIISDDVDQSLRDYWSKVRMNETPFNAGDAMQTFGFDLQEAYPRVIKNTNGLSDMMGQYGYQHGETTRPLMYGHDADYWGRTGNQSQEAFADLTAASVVGGPSQRYIQAVLPNTYEAYLAMLEDMAKR